MRIRLSMWRVLPAMLILFVLAGPVSLQGAIIVESTFTFSGSCTDCYDGAGNATATLTLQNYILGDELSPANLVSFVYDGTDLIPGGFTITPGDVAVLGGTIPAVLPGSADFQIQSARWDFSLGVEGDWSVSDLSVGDDYGTNGQWDAADGGVPEPGAFLLVAGGMALLGLRRRHLGR